MKLVPPIALLSGGVLMVFAALIAMVVWIEAASRSDIVLPQPPPKSFASSLAEATNLAATKQTCASVAQIYDTQVQIIQSQSAHISLLLKLLAGGIMALGLIVGPIFLYIYFVTRRHAAVAATGSDAL